MKALPNLTPLRFFLAFFVLLFHVPQLSKNQGLPSYSDLPMFQRGTEAVYMFFVLSGFLIIRLIFIEKKKEIFSIKNFYARRVLRILPLYYLISIFGFIFYHSVLPYLNIPYDNDYNLMEGLLLTLFFLANIFAKMHPGGILEILWSIAIEEQFYLFIAPLLFFVRTKKMLLLLITLFTLYSLIFHSEIITALKRYNFVYFFMLSGGIMALLEEHKKLEFLKNKKVVPSIAILGVLLYFFTDIFKTNVLIVYNLGSCVLFSFFIYAISHLNHSVAVRNNLITYLGKISYGLYMYQAIALNVVVYIALKVQKYPFFSGVVAIILINLSTFLLTVLCAHLSYQYFEKPFLRLKEKYRA